MKQLVKAIMALGLVMVASIALASNQYYLQQLTQGGPQSVRNAASSIYNSGAYDDQEVLDTLAEVMLQNYTRQDRSWIDAMNWAAKTLGSSGKVRYRSALEEVANSKKAHRKLRKWAKKGLSYLPAGDSPQYTRGIINLDAKRKAAQKAQAKQARQVAQSQASGNYKPITQAKVGMTMQEVIALCGPPTNQTSHITGKQFRPFNFRGKDTARTILLYKGQGRVVFSNESHYSSVYRVMEVKINPNESGYP